MLRLIVFKSRENEPSRSEIPLSESFVPDLTVHLTVSFFVPDSTNPSINCAYSELGSPQYADTPINRISHPFGQANCAKDSASIACTSPIYSVVRHVIRVKNTSCSSGRVRRTRIERKLGFGTSKHLERR